MSNRLLFSYRIADGIAFTVICRQKELSRLGFHLDNGDQIRYLCRCLGTAPLVCRTVFFFGAKSCFADSSTVQGGHGTGKTGNLVLTFSRQGKHREFCSDTGKNLLTQGKYFDCDY